jgi:hypothetical protein
VKQAINFSAILPHTPHLHDRTRPQTGRLRFAALFLRNNVLCEERKLDGSLLQACVKLAIVHLPGVPALLSKCTADIARVVKSKASNLKTDRPEQARKQPTRQWINSQKKQFQFHWKKRCARATSITR